MSLTLAAEQQRKLRVPGIDLLRGLCIVQAQTLALGPTLGATAFSRKASSQGPFLLRWSSFFFVGHPEFA
jgi:hypothetical protein